MRPQSAAVVGDERVRGIAGSAAQIRLLEVQRDGGDETLHVVHLPRRAALERHRADLFEVKHVRAEHDGHVDGAGFEQILAAVRARGCRR